MQSCKRTPDLQEDQHKESCRLSLESPPVYFIGSNQSSSDIKHAQPVQGISLHGNESNIRSYFLPPQV